MIFFFRQVAGARPIVAKMVQQSARSAGKDSCTVMRNKAIKDLTVWCFSTTAVVECERGCRAASSVESEV